jgi:UDP-glucose 4-epimerase
MNILVTGGAGYIGSVVAHYLRAHYGANVVLLDNMSNGSKQAAQLTDCPLLIGDISDYNLITNIVKHQKIDICVHCAASIDATESVRNPDKYFQNNATGTAELLSALRYGGVKKILFSSSVLAKVEQNPYGWSKQVCEKLLQQYREAYGMSYIVLRFENVAGATNIFSQWHKHTQTHLIPNIMDVAYGDREYLTVYGDGSAYRDYVHIEDVAYAHERAIAALANSAPAKTYTLGSGDRFSILEIVQVVSQITGRKIPIVFESPREDHVPNTCNGPSTRLESNENLARVENDLLWKPTKHLRDILQSAWQWKQAHPKGYIE